MNIRDFVAPDQLRLIRGNIDSRKVFEYKQSKKEQGTNYTLRFSGCFVDRDTADKIWHGNDYLVHYDSSYSGKLGYSGNSFAMAEFDQFNDWDAFKEWLDKLMSRYSNYEKEEYGQMCLF